MPVLAAFMSTAERSSNVSRRARRDSRAARRWSRDFSSILILRRGSSERRSASMPIREALVGVRDAQHGGLVEGATDELHADGQPLSTDAARQRAGRMAGKVEGPRQPDERRAYIGPRVADARLRLTEHGCRQRRRRREQHVATRERLVHLRPYSRAYLLGPDVLDTGDERTHLEPLAHDGLIVARPCAHPLAVIGTRLAGHDHEQRPDA